METLTAREQELVAAGGILGATLAFMMITAIMIYVLFIVAWWKILEKAGLKGWKSLIPIYNQYCIYRISGMSGWWIFLPIVASIFMNLGTQVAVSSEGNVVEMAITNTPIAVLGIIGLIASAVIGIVQVVKLAGNFGKGTGFKVASVFFPNITALILAFGSAKYNKKALHD